MHDSPPSDAHGQLLWTPSAEQVRASGLHAYQQWLAERHGVHLYQDPDAARRLLCRRPRDADLWEWIEPGPEIPKPPEGARPQTRASKASTEPGIPRRTLARLIDRLERL